MDKITIMQGDQCYIPLYLAFEDGASVGTHDVGDIELTIGRWTRRLALDEIEYDQEADAFLVFISQDISFSFPAGYYQIQVRVKSRDNHVIGENVGEFIVKQSRSKVVI